MSHQLFPGLSSELTVSPRSRVSSRESFGADTACSTSCSKYENWEQELAPRIILGLWHPLFIRPAYKYLPSCTRYHIGISPSIARQYFWDACAGFSINFSMLVGSEGQKFIADCRAAGKEVCVWTVNDPNEMRTAMTWGVQAILTDKVGLLTELKKEVSSRAATFN